MSINPASSPSPFPSFTRKGGMENNLMRKIITALCICIICFTRFLLISLSSTSSLTSRIRRNANSSIITQSNCNYINARRVHFIVYDILSMFLWLCIGITAAWILLRLLLIRCGRRLQRNWIDMGLPDLSQQFVLSAILFFISILFLLFTGLCLPQFLNEVAPNDDLRVLSCFQLLGGVNLVTVLVLGIITNLINTDHLPINQLPHQNPSPAPEVAEEIV